MKSHSEPNAIDEEGSLWAARLDGGNLSDNDHAAFSAWLKTSPEHRRAFEHYRDLSVRVGTHMDARLGEAVEAVVTTRAATRKRGRRVIVALAAAAMIAVLFSVLVRRPQDFTTKTGERHMATLEDGSKVELNARTALAVLFKQNERRVRLTSGEALFTVSKDARRPFVVETESGLVRVTGTVFDVRAASAGHVEVTVLEGTVRVRARDDSVDEQAVTSGSQAVLSDKAVVLRTLPEGAVQDVVAWQRGQVVFNDTPLSEVIGRFAAYHTRTIVVDPQAEGLRLGGRYSLDDLDGLLESIEAVLPVQVAHQPDGAIRISANDRRERRSAFRPSE